MQEPSLREVVAAWLRALAARVASPRKIEDRPLDGPPEPWASVVRERAPELLLPPGPHSPIVRASSVALDSDAAPQFLGKIGRRVENASSAPSTTVAQPPVVRDPNPAHMVRHGRAPQPTPAGGYANGPTRSSNVGPPPPRVRIRNVSATEASSSQWRRRASPAPQPNFPAAYPTTPSPAGEEAPSPRVLGAMPSPAAVDRAPELRFARSAAELSEERNAAPRERTLEETGWRIARSASTVADADVRTWHRAAAPRTAEPSASWLPRHHWAALPPPMDAADELNAEEDRARWQRALREQRGLSWSE